MLFYDFFLLGNNYFYYFYLFLIFPNKVNVLKAIVYQCS